jgi:transcription elongation GreA/GreB family factor
VLGGENIDVGEEKISIITTKAPLGKALLQAAESDEIRVNDILYTVLKIRKTLTK